MHGVLVTMIYFRCIVDILILVSESPCSLHTVMAWTSYSDLPVSRIINIASMAAFPSVLCGMIL